MLFSIYLTATTPLQWRVDIVMHLGKTTTLLLNTTGIKDPQRGQQNLPMRQMKL
ncbi:hypothetical protein D030_1417 [Vibrio parahaemolyticus AQ3810]|nr:hypothetical protein D030_1417 [Vibrio parahaemolyticus AQ3810]